MRDFFSMDGTLFRFLSKVADIMILNLLFILCCLPVVTIGAAVTALSYVTLKMKDQEEGYIWRSFFQSFKQNFGQATVIWLIMLVLGAVLGVDLWLTGAMQGNLQLLMRVCVGAGILVWLMVFLYVFPLQSRFYNTIGITMKNALLLAIGNFPRTACMILVMIGAAVQINAGPVHGEFLLLKNDPELTSLVIKADSFSVTGLFQSLPEFAGQAGIGVKIECSGRVGRAGRAYSEVLQTAVFINFSCKIRQGFPLFQTILIGLIKRLEIYEAVCSF